MYPTTHLSLRVAAVSFCVLLTTCYEYSALQNLNASCSPRDTCSLPRDLDHSEHHNCDCSALCVLHDTCCIDSPFLNLTGHFEPSPASCRSAGPDQGNFFMVDTCPRNYRGPQFVRRRCEQNAKDWSDPFNNVPVTHTSSQKTYKSVFCAICHGEDVSDVKMWQVALECSGLGEVGIVLCVEDRDYVLRNMVFVREKAQWGLWMRDSGLDWTLRFLHLGLRVPDDVSKYVRQCRPNLVSHCRPDWTDDSVREMCRVYMGVVYYDNATYRNVHCAMCNYEASDVSSCYSKDTLTYKGPSMSFGILLDIDLRDGSHVGTVERTCDEKQVFDPFSKKCRTIECPLPGYVLRHGKCAQQS